MELLRAHPGWQQFGSDEVFQQFVAWMGSVLLPVTDAWVAFKTPPPQWGHDGNVYANWCVCMRIYMHRQLSQQCSGMS